MNDNNHIVMQFAQKYKYLFIASELCILVTYAISFILPLLLSRFIDCVINPKDTEFYLQYIYLFLSLLATGIVSNILYAFLWQTLKNKYVVDIKNELFSKIICAKASQLSDMDAGDLITRIEVDADEFINIIQRNGFHFANSILLCIVIIVTLIFINPIMAAISILGAVLPVILTKLIGKKTENITHSQRKALSNLTRNLTEALKGLRDIKLNTAERWFKCRIFKEFKSVLLGETKLRNADFAINKLTHGINLLTSICVYFVSLILIIREQLTIGMFIAVIEYLAIMHRKFNFIMRIYLDWFSRRVSVKRVSEILNYEQENTCDNLFPISQIKSIRFNNVSFAYDKQNVLKNLSFEVYSGEHVGIVAKSGVGKTTILSLLQKIYEPQSGLIFINGIPMNDLSTYHLRRNMAVVSQNAFLYENTLRYNLMLGNQNQKIDDQMLIDICEKVGLTKMIQKLPNGLDTQIGKSYNLSGGQKQRIVIARALLNNAKLLIFDEATSQIDINTENKILSDIWNDPQFTIIFISHRLSSVKRCEKIIVLDDGKIDSIGAHENLMLSSAAYKNIFTNL